MKLLCVTILMKAIGQYFHVVLFITLYKIVLTFKSVDETLVCDHSNESYWAVLLCGTVYYAQGRIQKIQREGAKYTPPPPPALPLNENFTFKDVHHTALWACS